MLYILFEHIAEVETKWKNDDHQRIIVKISGLNYP